MTKDEALKLALDFIQKVNKDGWILADFEPQMYSTIAAIKEALAQPEQEPVAWLHTKIEGVAVPHRPADLDKHPDRWEALYKAPPPCQTCEALARTVMLDQTSHDTAPPQRKPLTEKRIEELYSFWVVDCQDIVGFARAVERTVKGEV